ncbi:MAG: hypothetical protein ACRDHL_13010 [Candidatus Promineifilaceae bacterium]
MPDYQDIIGFLQPLNGTPGAYLLLLSAAALLIARDWRASLMALTLEYLLAGPLFGAVLEPRLALSKLLVGLFVCLILYITARQVHWGRLPEDVSADEAVQWRQERLLRLGPALLATGGPFRVFLTLALILVVWALSNRPELQLPGVPDHFQLAILGLGSLGLVTLSLTSEPLRAGMGLLTFLLAFELLYAALEPSVALMAFLALGNLAVALVVAYLTQSRHAFTALLD